MKNFSLQKIFSSVPVPIGLTSTYCEASPKSIGAAEALDDDEDDTEVALDEG